jgi:phosphoribosylglycinamide formyltransferase 1
MNIIILTTDQYRHKFLINYLANQKKINIIACFIEKKLHQNYQKNISIFQKKHFIIRSKKEKLFFLPKNKKKKLKKVFLISPKQISKSQKVLKYLKKNYDYVISFGCSIIPDNVLEINRNKFINIHLGLSPYYLGSGTNFWPFVNDELQFLGATIMRTSKKLDKGKILHQIRPNIKHGSDIHDIGNQIIYKIIKDLKFVLFNIHKLKKIKFKFPKFKTKVYKRKDFDDQSLEKAYKNIQYGIVKNYLNKKNYLEKKYKIFNLKKLIKK